MKGVVFMRLLGELQLHAGVDFLPFILSELLAILTGGHADDFAEGAEEIGIIIEAALIGDIVEGGGTQHLLAGEHDPAIEHVIIDAAVGEADELMGKIGHADTEGAGEIFDADGLGVVIIYVGKNFLDDAAAEGRLALDGGGSAHSAAEEGHDIHHEGIILKTVIGVVFKGLISLVFADFANAGDKLLRILGSELIGADFTGGLGTKKLIKVDLAATQDPDDLRGEIEIGSLVIMHLGGAGETVHGEGRKDEDLVRLEEKEPVIHAHVFAAADVNVKLKIIMAVELRDLVDITDLIMRFIALMPLLTHWEKRRLGELRLPGSHENPPGLHCAEFAYIETRFI